MQIDRGVVERGDFLARLEATQPKNQPRQDSSLQEDARADPVIQAMPPDPRELMTGQPRPHRLTLLGLGPLQPQRA
jgi:hypothetical protein